MNLASIGFLILGAIIGATPFNEESMFIMLNDEIDLAVFTKRGMLNRCKEQGVHLLRRVL